jgi:hypothetical protein
LSAFFPEWGLFDLWMHTWEFKTFIMLILWIIAPFLNSFFDGKKRK